MGRGLLATVVFGASSIWAQSVISAHSGVIHLAEGQVTVDGNEIRQKFGEFGDVKTGQTLATEDGRAEVLLTPGVFLRVGENSSFKMVSNKLYDTKIEVVSGAAMVQVSELLEDNAISLLYHGTTMALTKKGLYRVDAEKGMLRVYDGEAKVTSAVKSMTARKGHEVQLDDQLVAKSFDTKDTDAFFRWNERRDEYISEANVYAAKSARDSGFGYMGASYAGSGSWAWNPWFGMFTYMPYSGYYYSPFGYNYYSPFTVGYLYMPGSPYYYGGGYSGTRGGGVSSPAIVTRNAASNTASTGIGRASATGSGFGSARGFGGFGGSSGSGPMMSGSGGGASAGGHGFGGGGGAGVGGGHAGGGMGGGGHAGGGAHR